MGHGELRQRQGGKDVHVKHSLGDFRVHLGRVSVLADARIIDEDIDLPEAFDGSVDHLNPG